MGTTELVVELVLCGVLMIVVLVLQHRPRAGSMYS